MPLYSYRPDGNETSDNLKRFMPFGMFKGQELRTLPRNYLQWVIKTCKLYNHLYDDIVAVLNRTPYEQTPDEIFTALYRENEDE